MIPFHKQTSPKLDSITDLKSALSCFQKLLRLRLQVRTTNDECDDDDDDDVVCNNGNNSAHSYSTNSTIITPLTANNSSNTTIVSSSCTTSTRTNNSYTMNGDDDHDNDDDVDASYDDDDETRSIDFIDTEIDNDEESMMIIKWLSLHGPSKKLLHDMEYVIEKHDHHHHHDVRDKKEEEQEDNVTDTSTSNHMKEERVKNMIDNTDTSDNRKDITSLSSKQSDTDSNNNDITNTSSTPMLSPKLHPPIQGTFMTTPVHNQIIQNQNNLNTNDSTMITKQRNEIGGRVRYNTIHNPKRTHSSRKKTKYKMTYYYGQKIKNYNSCIMSKSSQTSYWEEKLMNHKMKLNNDCGLEGDCNDVKGLIVSRRCDDDGSNQQKSKSNDVMLDDFVFHSQSSQP